MLNTNASAQVRKKIGSGFSGWPNRSTGIARSEEHTSELQSQSNLVCRLLLEKKKKNIKHTYRLAQRYTTFRLIHIDTTSHCCHAVPSHKSIYMPHPHSRTRRRLVCQYSVQRA